MNDTIRIPTMEKIRANCERTPVHIPYTRLFQEPIEGEQSKQTTIFDTSGETERTKAWTENVRKNMAIIDEESMKEQTAEIAKHAPIVPTAAGIVIDSVPGDIADKLREAQTKHVAPVVAKNIVADIEKIYRRLANKAPRVPKNVTLQDLLAMKRLQTKRRKAKKK